MPTRKTSTGKTTTGKTTTGKTKRTPTMAMANPNPATTAITTGGRPMPSMGPSMGHTRTPDATTQPSEPFAIIARDRRGHTAARRAYTARSAASIAVSTCLATDAEVRIRHDAQPSNAPDLAALQPSGTLGMSVAVTIPEPTPHSEHDGAEEHSEHDTPGSARAAVRDALDRATELGTIPPSPQAN